MCASSLIFWGGVASKKVRDIGAFSLFTIVFFSDKCVFSFQFVFITVLFLVFIVFLVSYFCFLDAIVFSHECVLVCSSRHDLLNQNDWLTSPACFTSHYFLITSPYFRITPYYLLIICLRSPACITHVTLLTLLMLSNHVCGFGWVFLNLCLVTYHEGLGFRV